MIVLFDADSLVYSSCCNVETIEEAIGKFDEVFMSIANRLEDNYDVKEYIFFNNSRGNFRKVLDKNYKANRLNVELPPLLNEMHELVTVLYDSKKTYGMETDDIVAKYWYKLSNEFGRDNVLIISIDKDYKQLPALIYNYHYKHRCIYDISEKQALYNFYEQMIIGDGADNVNYCKGYGKVYASKIFNDCKTHYQFTKKK